MKDGGYGNCSWQELAEYDDQVENTIFVIKREEIYGYTVINCGDMKV